MNASGSLKNGLKNLALVLLIVLLAFLCAANWLTTLRLDQLSSDNILRRAYDRVSGGAIGYEMRSSGIAAAEPMQIALQVGGVGTAAQYSLADIDAQLTVVHSTLESVFHSLAAQIPQQSDEAALSAALSHDCIYVRYDGGIPLCVLAGWYGGTSDSTLPASALVIDLQEQVLYLRTQDGALYAVPVTTGDTASLAEIFRGQACTFAGSRYPLYPETLLFENEPLYCEALAIRPLDLFASESSTSVQTMLTAFGYSAYTRSYSEQNGNVQVFVEDTSMLRIARSGTLSYAANASQSTVQAFAAGEASGADALSTEIDKARTVLDTVLRAANASTHAWLYETDTKDGETTLTFVQTYGGVPIMEDQDFASFTFSEGALTAATIRLTAFTADAEGAQGVLPASVAAVSADGTHRAMAVAYLPQESYYIAARYFTD